MNMNIIWYSPLLLAFLLSFTCAVHTSPDSGLYLRKAYEFTQGQIDWGFRPGFIALLVASFKTLGISVWSAAVVIRIFFFANVLLIFYMTKYIVNKQAAFAASLALLTSYYLTILSQYVLLDIIQPFFILLAIFSSMLAIDRRSDKIALTAGIVFVYSYLVKSTTLLFIPFPLILVFLWFGLRINFFKLRQAGIICATSVIGIIFYHSSLVFVIEKKANQSLGRASESALNLLFSDSLTGILSNALHGFVGFWHNFMFQDSRLGWLFAAAWAWVVIRSITHKNYRPMVVVYVLFLPAMLFLGLTNFRTGQAGVFLFASFIPIGVFLSDLSKGLGKIPVLLSKGYIGTTVSERATIIIITVGLCIYQTWYVENVYRSSSQWLQYTYIGRMLMGKETQWKLIGVFDKQSQRLAKIISKEAQPGAIIYTGITFNAALDFFTNYQYKVSRLPTGFIRIHSLQTGLSEDLPKESITKDLLFLWPNAWPRRLEHWNAGGELRIKFIEEDVISRLFRLNEPVFIALDKRYKHLGEYFERLSGVVKLSSNPLVYKVEKFVPAGEFKKPRVAYEIGMLLAELRERKPENYRVLRDDFFPRFFGLAPERVEALADKDEDAADVVFVGLPGRKY